MSTTDKIRLAPGLYLLADVEPSQRGRKAGQGKESAAKSAALVLDGGIPEAVEPMLKALDPTNPLTAAAIVYGYAQARMGVRTRVHRFAKGVAMSRRAIGRHIKTDDGLGVREAIDLGVFVRAAELLRGPRKITCGETAASIGTDPFTFSNWMHNRFGLRPSQLRQDPEAPSWKEALA